MDLASGGMGRVELALRQDGQFRRLYAIKRLHPHLSDELEFQDMFVQEARFAGLVRHPNVVGVLDVGRDASGPFLVMEYVAGLSLSQLLSLSNKENERLPVQVAVRIALDIARGLHAVHEARDHDGVHLGLVHRDLSPQNVLLGYDGTVAITDFGVAKAFTEVTKTATGFLKGKLSYMAPEQVRLEPVDRRSDLFALGVVIFEALANTRLYRGAEGAQQMLNDVAPDITQRRSDVPEALVDILASLMMKARDDRPADSAQVAQRLEGVLATLLRDEPPVELSSYLAKVAGAFRVEQDSKTSAAFAALEGRRTGTQAAPLLAGVEPIFPPRPAQARRYRFAMFAGVVVAALVLLAAAAARVFPVADAPQVGTLPVAVTVLPPLALPDRATVAAPVSVAAPAASASLDAGGPVAEPDPTPRPTWRPPTKARSAALRRPRSPAASPREPSKLERVDWEGN